MYTPVNTQCVHVWELEDPAAQIPMLSCKKSNDQIPTPRMPLPTSLFLSATTDADAVQRVPTVKKNSDKKKRHMYISAKNEIFELNECKKHT